uniref:hypothetical protein n=1 Tax=Pseudomonas sp. SST3 TaxID=2267882 RepID=UPI00313A2F23
MRGGQLDAGSGVGQERRLGAYPGSHCPGAGAAGLNGFIESLLLCLTAFLRRTWSVCRFFLPVEKPQAHRRSEGGSWLACDSHLSVSPSLADTPLSQASPHTVFNRCFSFGDRVD